jgi:hypothetical protein
MTNHQLHEIHTVPESITNSIHKACTCTYMLSCKMSQIVTKTANVSFIIMKYIHTKPGII